MRDLSMQNSLAVIIPFLTIVLASCHSFEDKPKDYIEIDITLQPIITDSIDGNARFTIFKDKPVVCGWPDENQQAVNGLPTGVRFFKPLRLDSIESKGNSPENKYLSSSLLNDSTIGTIYHLKCWPRRIWRPGQPKPPDPPYQSVEIKFAAKTRYWGHLNTSIAKFHQKSSTTQVFILEYNNLPTSPNASIQGWKWTANVSVHKDGGVNEFPLSDEFPNLGNWRSEIVHNKLLTQYKP